MAYDNDFQMIDGEKIWRNVYYELDESKLDIYQNLKNNKKSAVVFPIFTAAAYSEPGFYTFYRGECDQEFHGVLFREDDCLTVKIDEEYNPGFTSSANGLQVLSLLGYDVITDITIHQNPNVLAQYEKIILLHNEYVTSVEFDAIISHPNVIYLYPNALYAEIDVNYDNNTMTLIRGHQYPDESIANGFDYAIEQEFHDYEYDSDCLEWEFIEIENGFHLNCYPDGIIHKNLDILLKMKELTSDS